jgi:hypothetical protein
VDSEAPLVLRVSQPAAWIRYGGPRDDRPHFHFGRVFGRDLNNSGDDIETLWHQAVANRTPMTPINSTTFAKSDTVAQRPRVCVRVSPSQPMQPLRTPQPLSLPHRSRNRQRRIHQPETKLLLLFFKFKYPYSISTSWAPSY